MQKENKKKKEYLENLKPEQPYKMKEFQNIGPKVSTVNNIKIEHRNINSQPMVKSKSLNKFKSNLESKRSDSIGNKGQIYNYNGNQKFQSNRINHELELPNHEENIYNAQSINAQEDFRIMGKDAYVLSHNVYNESQTKSKTNELSSKNIKNTHNDNTKKQKLKGETPKANQINQLLPKTKKNYIAENKIKAIEATKKPEPRRAENIEHKNYGKVPE